MNAPPPLPADLLERTQTPALVIYLERVRHNARRVIEVIGGDPARWRPHLKTTKMPELWRELFALGVRHYKCATTREAAVFLDAMDGAPVDLLVAYPLVGPGLARLGRIASAHPTARVSVLIEGTADAASVPDPLSIFVDVDAGMHRTGVSIDAVDRIIAAAAAAGSRLRGFHWYDGHLVHDDRAERRARAHAGYTQAVDLIEQARRAGLVIDELVTSGTPSFPDAVSFAPFRTALGGATHRVSPGTVVLHDVRTAELLPEVDLVPAALVLTRVVSRPAADRFTCDAGAKAIAAEAGDPCAVALGRPEFVAQRPSEEHLPFGGPTGATPDRGAVLCLFPRHVCPTVNLAEEAVLVEGDGTWRVAPVAARAHELIDGGRDRTSR